MRAVVQRVAWANVSVSGEVVGSCSGGLLVLVGAHHADVSADAQKLATRIAGLRVFPDSEGKMNLSLDQLIDDDECHVLAISNFTVYGDAVKSRRPSFTASAPYAEGEALFNEFVECLRAQKLKVETGVFGADMQVQLQNEGPVTLVVDAGPSLVS